MDRVRNECERLKISVEFAFRLLHSDRESLYYEEGILVPAAVW